MTGLVQPPGAAIGKQPCLFEFDAEFRDPALHGVILNDWAPECASFRGARHHQFDQKLAQSDRAHAMVDAREAKTDLRHPKTVAFGAEQVFPRYAHIVEREFADRGGVILATHPAQPPDQPHSWRIHRHDDAGMAAGAVGVRIADPEHDQETAARVRGAGDEPFAARDDEVVAVAHHSCRDIGRVG